MQLFYILYFISVLFKCCNNKSFRLAKDVFETSPTPAYSKFQPPQFNSLEDFHKFKEMSDFDKHSKNKKYSERDSPHIKASSTVLRGDSPKPNKIYSEIDSSRLKESPMLRDDSLAPNKIYSEIDSSRLRESPMMLRDDSLAPNKINSEISHFKESPTMLREDSLAPNKIYSEIDSSHFKESPTMLRDDSLAPNKIHSEIDSSHFKESPTMLRDDKLAPNKIYSEIDSSRVKESPMTLRDDRLAPNKIYSEIDSSHFKENPTMLRDDSLAPNKENPTMLSDDNLRPYKKSHHRLNAPLKSEISPHIMHTPNKKLKASSGTEDKPISEYGLHNIPVSNNAIGDLANASPEKSDGLTGNFNQYEVVPVEIIAESSDQSELPDREPLLLLKEDLGTPLVYIKDIDKPSDASNKPTSDIFQFHDNNRRSVVKKDESLTPEVIVIESEDIQTRHDNDIIKNKDDAINIATDKQSVSVKLTNNTKSEDSSNEGNDRSLNTDNLAHDAINDIAVYLSPSSSKLASVDSEIKNINFNRIPDSKLVESGDSNKIAKRDISEDISDDDWKHKREVAMDQARIEAGYKTEELLNEQDAISKIKDSDAEFYKLVLGAIRSDYDTDLNSELADYNIADYEDSNFETDEKANRVRRTVLKRDGVEYFEKEEGQDSGVEVNDFKDKSLSLGKTKRDTQDKEATGEGYEFAQFIESPNDAAVPKLQDEYDKIAHKENKEKQDNDLKDNMVKDKYGDDISSIVDVASYYGKFHKPSFRINRAIGLKRSIHDPDLTSLHGGGGGTRNYMNTMRHKKQQMRPEKNYKIKSE